jgi:hypothetical protein
MYMIKFGCFMWPCLCCLNTCDFVRPMAIVIVSSSFCTQLMKWVSCPATLAHYLLWVTRLSCMLHYSNRNGDAHGFQPMSLHFTFLALEFGLCHLQNLINFFICVFMLCDHLEDSSSVNICSYLSYQIHNEHLSLVNKDYSYTSHMLQN